MKRIVAIITIAMVLLITSMPTGARSNRDLWHKSGCSDQQRLVIHGEGGIDCGGSCPWCDTDDLNLVPVSVSITTINYGGITLTKEKGELNSGIYYIFVPQFGFNGKAIINLHPTGVNDIYHTWPANWAPFFYDDELTTEALSKGYAMISVSGTCGGHAIPYMIQRTLEVSLYAEQQYGISESFIFGASYGGLVAPYLTFFWPERFRGAFISGCTAFNLQPDLRLTRANSCLRQAFQRSGYNWNYDPADDIAIDSLAEQAFKSTLDPAAMSMAQRMWGMGSPIIALNGNDDFRVSPNLWAQPLAHLDSDRFRNYIIDKRDHNVGLYTYYQNYEDATGQTGLEGLEEMAASTKPSLRSGVERHGLVSALWDDLLNEVPNKTEINQGYIEETWKSGWGFQTGLFDSMILADVDADPRMEVVVGAAGGSAHILQQTGAVSLNWAVDHLDLGDVNMGYGVYALAYDEDAVIGPPTSLTGRGLIWAGSQIGRLWVFNPHTGALVHGPSSADFGSDIQHLKVTQDLDENGLNEVWFRTWNKMEWGGGVLWCVEYDPTRDSFTTKASQRIDGWIGDFLIVDYDHDGQTEAIVAGARGGIGAYPISMDPLAIGSTPEKWTWISNQNYFPGPHQYWFESLRMDDNYLYALTGPSRFCDFSNPGPPTYSHLVAQAEEQRVLWLLDREDFDQQSGVYDYVAVGDTDCFELHEENGATWILTSDPDLRVRKIDTAGNQIGDPSQDIAGWPVERNLLSIRAADLTRDLVSEIVATDVGGNIITASFGWDPDDYDQAGEQPEVETETFNRSHVFGLTVQGGNLYGQKGYGRRYQIDPTDGSLIGDPLATSFVGLNRAMIHDGSLFVTHQGSLVNADFGYGAETIYTSNWLTGGGEPRGGATEEDGLWTTDYAFGHSMSDTWRNSTIVAADIDADGDQDLLLGTVGGRIRCYEKAGDTGIDEAPLWELDDDLGTGITAIAAANMENGDELEVVVGVWYDENERGTIYWLYWDGSKLAVDYSRTRHLDTYVTSVAIVQRSGRWLVLVGTGTGRLYCLDQNLKTIYRSARIGGFMGGFNSMIVDDLDGDGVDEIYCPDVDRLRRFDFTGAVSSTISPTVDIVSPVVTVTAPNGGETWIAGAEETISWTASDNVGITAHKIEYSTDGGSEWAYVYDWVAGDPSSYTLTVPPLVTSSCLMRVSVRDEALNEGSDQSNAVFSIVDGTNPTVTLISPNGGEQWDEGSAHDITWTADDEVGIAEFRILYSTDGGGAWTTVVPWYPGDPDSYTWWVPIGTSANCKVAVSVRDAELHTASDDSDDVFEILDNTPPAVDVTSPDGGESWAYGSAQDITWTATDLFGVTEYRMDYRLSSISAWVEIFDWTAYAAPPYSWTLPSDVVTPAALVRVQCRDALLNVGTDTSAAVFSIVDATNPTVTVVSPNGGEEWDEGSVQEITWTADDAIGIAGYRILYSTDGGENWGTVVPWHAGDPDIHLWTVPSAISANCKIAVSVRDAALNEASDQSNVAFEILDATAPVVDVTAPDGGESWAAGSAQDVTWTATDLIGVTEYRMDYRITELGSWVEIFDWTSYSAPPYSWTLPSAVVSTTARVRVQCRDSELNEGTDMSAAVFSIVDGTSPTVTVVSPNGGEQWEEKSIHNITWTADDNIGISYYKVDYSTDGGSGWLPVTIGWVAGNPDIRAWTVPIGASSATCLVKVSVRDAALNEAADQSNAVFEITAAP